MSVEQMSIDIWETLLEQRDEVIRQKELQIQSLTRSIELAMEFQATLMREAERKGND